MSSVAVAVAADEVTVAADAVEKAPRRFPPPCWTQEEALNLIDAYRERWYALRRGYLRTADWDAVAAAVATRCPGASPAKTSAQCRHKIEKLRQRYRAEKQRALSLPSAGRYFSSWFFFDNMEAMENGTTAPTPAQRSDHSVIDQNMLKLKLKPESSPDLEGYGRAKSATAIPIQYSSAIAYKDDQPANRIPIAIPSLQPKSVKLFNDFDPGAGSRRHQVFPPAPGLRNEKFGSGYSKFVGPGARLKRGRSGLEEIVASIKLVGEGFVKMEKEKMEMSREMEVMRMEMEMKRNQMMVESQKQIVDVFLKGLVELNKKKKSKNVKPGVGVAENSTGT